MRQVAARAASGCAVSLERRRIALLLALMLINPLFTRIRSPDTDLNLR